MGKEEIAFEAHEDEAEGGLVAHALGRSIVSQAKTWEELRKDICEAVLCHFEEGQAPHVIRLDRVVDEVLALAGSVTSRFPTMIH